MYKAGRSRILVIDDLLGRVVPGARNEDRESFCGDFLVEDVTGDGAARRSKTRVKNPVAEVVFCRGQTPVEAGIGDTVKNDFAGILETVQKGWHCEGHTASPWALVLVDLCFYTGKVTPESHSKTSGMPEPRNEDSARYFGHRVMTAIRERFRDVPVATLTAQPRGEVSHESFARGALTFFQHSGVDSAKYLEEVLDLHGLIQDSSRAIVGHSKQLLLALRAARRSARTGRNILILGERGTGKELLAKYIHNRGPRRSVGDLVTVDCGALSDELYASELFGYSKGAFTGATRNRQGQISHAHGSDLFLDEIGNMPPKVQSGLLRVLGERQVTPLGSNTSQAVDVRFISATNKDVEGLANYGSFPRDLLDRLREGDTVKLPPLRERREDIPLLAEAFVRQAEAENREARKRSIDPNAIDKLASSDWPGNIRELKNCIYKAVNNHPDVEHLVPIHLQLPKARTAALGEPHHLEVAQTEFSGRSAEKGKVAQEAPVTLEQALTMLESFSFEEFTAEQLAGQLDNIDGAWARFLTRYLRAVLFVTRKPTAKNPAGIVCIQPAIRLAKGDPNLSQRQPKDILKRFFKRMPEALEAYLQDPLLEEAYRRSLGSKKKSR